MDKIFDVVISGISGRFPKCDDVATLQQKLLNGENLITDENPKWNLDYIVAEIWSILATNCSGERSFSTLKRVKTHLRASMGQDRLNALALLSIEAQLVQEIEYNDKSIFLRGPKPEKKF